ncbi:MAG: DNA adenine methylase [Cellvibrionales bacterium]|nr:DNA adenine methylase [Cellvibrionales bacterium]
MRSPLRYPGGKSRAVDTILDLMPPGLDCIASPFFGGGSIELALVSNGVQVSGYDIFEPLVAFWQAAINAPQALAKRVAVYHPMNRDIFYSLQKKMRDDRVLDTDIAAVFFALNRCSFSGTTLSGGMSPGHPRFTQSSIDRVCNFDSHGLLSVERLGFEESIARHSNDFLYCDPPYANGGALYGQRGDCHVDFDHESLAEILTSRDGWILSYNDCPIVRDLYAGFTVLDAAWSYGMNSDKKSNEILVLSKDLM